MFAVSLDPNTFIFYLGNGPELNGRSARLQRNGCMGFRACMCVRLCVPL